MEYEKGYVINAPKGHQKTRVHFVFDVKHCGKFKARLVADGHLTMEPTETVYSGVVSLRSLRLAMFLPELNNLQLWGADVGNAYLQALTKEKLYIVAGPEAEELQEHDLLMYKALDGTRSGGPCWHDKPLDILQPMYFLQPPLFSSLDISRLLMKAFTHTKIKIYCFYYYLLLLFKFHLIHFLDYSRLLFFIFCFCFSLFFFEYYL